MLMVVAVLPLNIPVREGPVPCCQSISGRVCTKVGMLLGMVCAVLQGLVNVAVPVGVACFSKS